MKRSSLARGGSWLGAVSGAGLPAITYFTTLAPPLFAEAGLITSALAGAILIIAATWKAKNDTGLGYVKIAAGFLAVAIPLLVAYSLLLNFTTVVGPGVDGTRYQIGFGRAEFSLTEVGNAYVKHNPTLQPKQLMMNEAAFDQDRVPILWKTWLIYAAGLLLIVVYFFGFLCWTIGFALLAKHQRAK